jgi:hypothetical protein
MSVLILIYEFPRFHEFLKLENEIGNITRQEAVSMVGQHSILSVTSVVYLYCYLIDLNFFGRFSACT